MHEHQNQRGRGRGGEHAARRGRGSRFHTDAHLSQNHDSYNTSYAPGTNPNYSATNQSGSNTQPTSYNNSALFVPSSVQSRYTSTNHQQHFDQPVRLHQFTLPIRTSRVESTKTDEHHKSDNQASQTHYSGTPAQPVPEPGYYSHSAPGAQVSLPAFVLPIRNHSKTPLESSKIEKSNTGDLQNSYGSYQYTPQQNPVTPAYHPNMSYPYDNSQYNYAPGAAPAYQYPQQGQQSYDQNPPAIRNPFPAPPPARNAYGVQNAGYDPEQEALMAQWQSQYAPADVQAMRDARGKAENPNVAPVGQRPGAAPAAAAADGNTANPEKKVTVIRKGGGQVWEDNTLLEWDPTQFRIMVGNLAGEVTDDSLAKAFAQYGVSKARVIRDKRTTKSKGFGFVSFTDGELGFKAAREMVGKYIGSHPVTIQRSKTDLKPVVQKDKYKGKGKNNKNNNRNDKKEKKKEDDPLRAHTGAVIEKKPVKNAGGYKVIG
jgi:hypothetical protein